MRKAFTLIEMLVLIAVAPIVMLTISRVFATFIRDLPRETKVVQQNTTVENLLVQIRQDMDQAVALPAQSDGTQAGDKTLLIEQPGAVVRYHFETGRTVRTVLKGQTAGEQRTWRMPDAVVSCQLWMGSNAACAVELHSYVQRWAGTMRRNYFVGDRVLFVGGLGKVREVQ